MLDLFSTGDFIPHGHCYLWQPTLVWLHLLSDSAIALAYYAIPFFLFALARQRADLPLRPLFWLFGAFIVACGTTHLMDVWTLWHPVYWLAAGLKVVTALISVVTAVVLFQRLPQALALPSTAQLAAVNQRLQVEIIERRAAEAQLHEAQRIARMGHWEYDLMTQITTWSEALWRLFGATPTANAIPYTEQLPYFLPESRAQLESAVAQVQTTGTPYVLELQYTRLDGATAWMLARGEVLCDAAGAVVKLVGTALDITEHKRLETEQQRLSQLKDDFLNAASHELRTPLASIKMAVRMTRITLDQCAPPLLETHPTQAERLSRYLTMLETQCDREVQLVNELLETQRLESGHIVPEWQPVNLLERLAPLLEVYQERATARQLTLRCDQPDDLPDL